MVNGGTAIVTGLTEASDLSGKKFIGLVTDQGILEISQKTASEGYRGLDADGFFSQRNGPALFRGYVVLVDPAYNVVNKELLIWLRELGVNVVLGGKMRLSNDRWGNPVPNEGEEVQFRGDRDDALCMYIHDTYGEHWYPIVFLNDNGDELCCIRKHYDTSGAEPVFDYYLIDTVLSAYDTCWVYLNDSETMAYIFQRAKFDQSKLIKSPGGDFDHGGAEDGTYFMMVDDEETCFNIYNIWNLGQGYVSAKLNNVASEAHPYTPWQLEIDTVGHASTVLAVLMRGWQFWTDKRIGNFIAKDKAGVIKIIDDVRYQPSGDNMVLSGRSVGTLDYAYLYFIESDNSTEAWAVEILGYNSGVDTKYNISGIQDYTAELEDEPLVDFAEISSTNAFEFIFSKLSYEGIPIEGDFVSSEGDSVSRLESIGCEVDTQALIAVDSDGNNWYYLTNDEFLEFGGYVSCAMDGNVISLDGSPVHLFNATIYNIPNLLATLIFGWRYWYMLEQKVFDPFVQPTRERDNVLCLPQINENLPIVLFKDFNGLEYPVFAYLVMRNNGLLTTVLGDPLSYDPNADNNPDEEFPHKLVSLGSAYTQQVKVEFARVEYDDSTHVNNVTRAILSFRWSQNEGIYACVDNLAVVFCRGIMCTDDVPTWSDIDVDSSVVCCVAGLMVRYICTAPGEFDAYVDGDENFGWLHYAFQCGGDAIVSYENRDRMYLEDVVRVVRDIDATVNGVTIGSFFNDMDSWVDLGYYWPNSIV